MVDQEVSRLAKALERFNALADKEALKQEAAATGRADDDGSQTVMTQRSAFETMSGESELTGGPSVDVPWIPTRVTTEPEAQQTKRNELLHEALKKVAAAFRSVKEKESLCSEGLVVYWLGRALQHSLFTFASAPYEALAKEACPLLTAWVRVLGHRGGEWAMDMVAGLLDRLQADSPECVSAVYASLCAIASHCFVLDAPILSQILTLLQNTDMDTSVRKQCYGLIKVVIEKWPPSCVTGVQELCQRLIMDMESDVDETVSAAMASLVVLCRKWPDVGLTTVKQLSRPREVRLYKEYPQLHTMLSPRRTRRKSFPSSSSTGPPSPRDLEPASAHGSGFGGSLSSERKSNGSGSRRRSSGGGGGLGQHPSSLGLDPARANSLSTSGGRRRRGGGTQPEGQGRLQQFINWKLAKDGGLAEALSQQQGSGGLDSLDVSEDGSTTSSLRSEGAANPNTSRGSNTPGGGCVGAEERRRRQLTMLSPTLRQFLPTAGAPMTEAQVGLSRASLSLHQSPLTPDSPLLPFLSDPPSAGSSVASSPGRPLQIRPSSTTCSLTGSGSRIAAAFQQSSALSKSHRPNRHTPSQPNPNTSTNTGLPLQPLSESSVALPLANTGTGSGRPSFYLSSEDVSRDPSRNTSREASPRASSVSYGPEGEDRENMGNRFGNAYSQAGNEAGVLDGKKAREAVEEEEEQAEEAMGRGGGLDADEEEELARLEREEDDEAMEGRVLFEELCVEGSEDVGAHHGAILPIAEEKDEDLQSSGPPSPSTSLAGQEQDSFCVHKPSSKPVGGLWCWGLLSLLLVVLSACCVVHKDTLAVTLQQALTKGMRQGQGPITVPTLGNGSIGHPTAQDTVHKDKKSQKKTKKGKAPQGEALHHVTPSKASKEGPVVNAQPPTGDKKDHKASAQPQPQEHKEEDKKEEKKDDHRNIALFSWRAPLTREVVMEPVGPEPPSAVSVIAPAPTSRYGRRQHHKAKDAAGQALLVPSSPYEGANGQGRRSFLPPWRRAWKRNLLDPLGRLLKEGAMGFLAAAVLVTLALV